MQQAERTRAAETATTQQGTRQELPTRPALTRLERLKARDRDAQEGLYRERRRQLEALAASVLDCRADAASLVDDVLTDFLFRYVDTIRSEAAMFAYLRMMTIRRARRQNDRHGRQDDVGEDETTQEVSGLDLVDEVDGRIWATWLQACLAALPQKPRQLLRLRFGHDLSMDEVGSQVGVSKQAVSKTIQKCLDALRACLERKRARQRRAGSP